MTSERANGTTTGPVMGECDGCLKAIGEADAVQVFEGQHRRLILHADCTMTPGVRVWADTRDRQIEWSGGRG